jgi:hypothetical protein
MASTSRVTVWRNLTIFGGAVVAFGQGATLLDFAAMGGVDFVDQHFELFMLAIPVGFLLVFIGAICWARHLIRGHRIALAAIVFLAPLSCCLLVGLFVGTNVHGPFFLFFFSLIPALILSVVLLVMAAVAKN